MHVAPELWWKKLKVKPINRSGEPIIRLITATFEDKYNDNYNNNKDDDKNSNNENNNNNNNNKGPPWNVL